MVKTSERDIVVCCVVTRLLYIVLSSVSRLVLPKHEPDVFVSPLAQTSRESTLCDRLVTLCLGGFTGWDAQHFYQIADSGYVFEQSLAFFPLYPALLASCVKLITPLVGEMLSSYSKLILVSVVLNTFVFTLSTLALYRLGIRVLGREPLARKSALLFCFSPASVFFIASYTESLYSFLVFSGMLLLARGRPYQSALLFALATATRSNGVVNAGYILHYFAFKLVDAYRISVPTVSKVKLAIKAILYTQLVICPYILFQLYGYYVFCTESGRATSVHWNVQSFGRAWGYTMPGDDVTWCNAIPPFPYSHIQKRYWDVGFLLYYTYKQIPNFLLALPITSIILPYSLLFLYTYRRLFLHLRYIYSTKLKMGGVSLASGLSLLPRSTFVYTVHTCALLLYCLVNINVQVTTRMICSSSPLLYWIASTYFQPDKKNRYIHYYMMDQVPLNKIGASLKTYFVFYSLVGVVLFSSEYPWT